MVSEVNDRVAAVYNAKFYIDKAIKIDDQVEKFSFYEHKEELSRTPVFHEHKRKNETWVVFSNIFCIILSPENIRKHYYNIHSIERRELRL